MADPWSVVSQTPAAPQTPWAVVGQKPAPSSPYESEKQFRTRMDATYGAGKWKETSGYRAPGQEDSLRRRGAGTVPAGHISDHSRGTPDAPGAHDIVVSGVDPATAAKRLPKDYRALPEGRVGPEGPHLHIDDADPWAVASTKPAPKPVAPAPAKPAPAAKPKQPGILDAIGQDAGAASDAVGRYIDSTFGAQVKGAAHQVAQDVREDKAHLGKVDPVGSFAHPLAAGGVARLPKEAWDVVDTAMSPAAGVFDAAVARPVAEGEAALAHLSPEKKAKLEQDNMLAMWGLDGGEGETRGASRPISTDPAWKPVKSVPAPPKAPRGRALAASTADKEPRTDIVGDEPHAPTRTANALYRLNGSNIADKIELGGARKALQKAHGDKSEALYHALEEPLAGGDAKLSPELAEAKTALQPYLKEQTDIINRLRERNDPTLDKFTEDQGYVHRIRSDQPDLLDSSDQGGPRSPFQTRKSLVKTASSQKERKYIALEDPQTGERIFPKGQGEKGDPYGELKPSMTFRPAGEAPKGQPEKAFKVVQPTTKEIEANTPTRYKKDAIDNTIANVFQLRRVERNLDVLEQTLADMKERGVAHREEWTYKDPETGKPTVGRANAETPQGFRSLPDVPQLKGWKFDHNDAQVQELKDWLPKHDEDWVQRLDRINNFMLRSNFLSPFVHPKNIAEFWGASRGWDWLHPEGYGRLARTLPEAWREVMTMGPKYQQYLREGSALLSADSRTQDFNAMLTDKAGDELINDPKSFDGLKKAFGDIVGTPAQLYAKFQEASHKMMWSLGDTMMMQRVLELQDKGMPIRDAIAKAEEMIPNYRVPAQIMNGKTGGRMLHHLFANNRFFSVGRYHYNRLAAWGRMFRKVVKGSPEEKKEALGQFLAMAVMGAVVLPAVDKGLQIATGNQNARVKRGGVLALPDAAVRTAEGKEGVAQAIAQVVDLSPEARTLVEGVTNKDYFGNDRFSKYRSLSGNAAGAAELPLSQFGPAQGTLEALSPGYGPERTIGNMFGVDLPSKPPGQVKGSTAKMLRGRYKHQDHNDPLARMLGAR